jgi:hypothetical protein
LGWAGRAVAETQAKVVDTERTVAIKEFAAPAAIRKAEGTTKAKTTIAEANTPAIKRAGETPRLSDL